MNENKIICAVCGREINTVEEDGLYFKTAEDEYCCESCESDLQHCDRCDKPSKEELKVVLVECVHRYDTVYYEKYWCERCAERAYTRTDEILWA